MSGLRDALERLAGGREMTMQEAESKKRLYWTISGPHWAQSCTDTPQGIVEWLEMYEGEGEGSEEPLTLKPIWMTPEEHAALPEFTGP